MMSDELLGTVKDSLTDIMNKVLDLVIVLGRIEEARKAAAAGEVADFTAYRNAGKPPEDKQP